MSDSGRKKTRITWKQAYHKLKRAALRSYRIRHFSELVHSCTFTDLNHIQLQQFQLQTSKTEINLKKPEKEAIQPLKRIMSTSTSAKRTYQYPLITFLQNHEESNGSHDLFEQENKLAESIISGIIDEIRSRSETSREKSSSASSSRVNSPSSQSFNRNKNVDKVYRNPSNNDDKHDLLVKGTDDRRIVLKRPKFQNNAPTATNKKLSKKPEKSEIDSRPEIQVKKTSKKVKIEDRVKNVNFSKINRANEAESAKQQANKNSTSDDSRFVFTKSSEKNVSEKLDQLPSNELDLQKTEIKYLNASENFSGKRSENKEIQRRQEISEKAVTTQKSEKLESKQSAEAELFDNNIKEPFIHEPEPGFKSFNMKKLLLNETLAKNEPISKDLVKLRGVEEKPTGKASVDETFIVNDKNIIKALQEQINMFSPSNLTNTLLEPVGDIVVDNVNIIEDWRGTSEESLSLDFDESNEKTEIKNRELNIVLPSAYTDEIENEEENQVAELTLADLGHTNQLSEINEISGFPKIDLKDPILLKTSPVVADQKELSIKTALDETFTVQNDVNFPLNETIENFEFSTVIQSSNENDINLGLVEDDGEHRIISSIREADYRLFETKGLQEISSPRLFSISKFLSELPDQKEDMTDPDLDEKVVPPAEGEGEDETEPVTSAADTDEVTAKVDQAPPTIEYTAPPTIEDQTPPTIEDQAPSTVQDQTLEPTAEPTENPEAAEQTEAAENQEEVVTDEEVEDPKAYLKEQAKLRNKGDGIVLADDYYYDYESLVFKPLVSNEEKLSPGLLNLFHSFGYDCKKRFNLNIIDSETLLFSAGNMVQILNIVTKKQTFLKTLSGGAVGAIKVHPSCKYFAVGEKGCLPNINIYEYPSLKLFRMLRKGVIKGYAYLDFDPEGNLLASLGAEPDYTLTVWDWRKEKIVLRTKAFSQDIYKCTFSKDLKGTLTSSGTGHIKFWKMASTFTGYKLQGDLGKFGKTEISDIEGYAELPDGKVLSGSEWGNMLLWDGGLIQTEICRKRKPCHAASIHQITLDDGDIYTMSDDGIIRVWDFETIDTAEPSEEGVKLEMEPLNELKVGTGNVALYSMVKDVADESTIWFAQDSNGGIWRLDLSFSASSENPRQLFAYHAGVINGIGCSPNTHHFATTADDGSIKVYDYLTYDIIAQARFKHSGCSLKWLSTKVDPDGATVCTGHGDGLLRFLKVRPNEKVEKAKTKKVQKMPYELALFEIFKPHTKPITLLSVNPSGSLIVTASLDKTLFFFENKENKRMPIGFVNLTEYATYLTWKPSEFGKSCLLVCQADGTVLEYEEPVPGTYNTTKTFLIDLKFRRYKFTSIKSRLRHDEELERLRLEEIERHDNENRERKARGLPSIEEEAEAKRKKKLKKKKEEDGDDDEAAEGGEGADEVKEETFDEEEKKKEVVDDWKPFIPEVASKVCWAVYSSPDTFWLSMDAYDAGYLYECRFINEADKAKMSMAQIEKLDEPFKSIPVMKSDLTHTDDIPLTCMIQDKFKRNLLIGQKNGTLRIQPMAISGKFDDLQDYWSYGFHDTENGNVTNLELSFNQKFLFSTGQDSNIFGVLFNCGPEELEKAKSENLQIGTNIKVTEIPDIDDPTAYSIEEAKQKSENDKVLAVAETKMAQMRQKITELRKMFKTLTIKNENLIPRLRVDKSQFAIEGSVKDQVIGQINEKIVVTHKELAWQSEKNRLLLEKIQMKYKDMIDCEHIVLFTFDRSLEVASFRTVALPRDMEQYKKTLEEQYLSNLLEKQKKQENPEATTLDSADEDDENKELSIKIENTETLFNIESSSNTNNLTRKSVSPTDELMAILDNQLTMEDIQLPGLSAADQIRKIFGSLQGATAQRIERALRKMEERKLKRLKRKREWKMLLGSKLPDDYENPVDLASIKFAKENLGDFKLKSSKDFFVPEEQRMNVYKAVERLMQIKQFLHDNQMNFNQKLKTLRDKKVELVADMNRTIDRLEKIEFILGEPLSMKLVRPQLRIEEVPERKYEYTPEKLIEFKKELELKAGSSQSTGEEQGGFGGGFGGSNAASNKSNSAKKYSAQQRSNESKNKISNLEGLQPLWSNIDSMTPLMKQITRVQEIRLRHEQNQLLESIDTRVCLFDAELRVLRHEKAKADVFMKNADLRHVTIFEEFLLLRDFEKTETILEQKQIERKEGHVELQRQVKSVQRAIDAKKKDIDGLENRQKQLLDTYHAVTRDETKFADYLYKVFKKKIKRRKRTEGDEDEEEESDDDEDDDDDESEDEDDGEDDDSEAGEKEQLDLDICPASLKQDLYDQVCQLREKKLDLEEGIAEEKKVLEQSRKDLDSLVKKARLADNELKKAKQELENFQKEKQKKINELDIVVTMRLDQLQYLKNQKLPHDLSNALVFDASNLIRLQARIKDLQQEKTTEKKLFKNLKDHHHELILDKKKMDQYVGKLNDVCNKMMIDKFGKLVELEKLENIVVNQQIEELKQRMQDNEEFHVEKMRNWKSQINKEKDEQIELLKANTTRLNEIADMMIETKQLETKLDAKQSSLGEDLTGSSKKDIEERQRLHTLVQLQAQEVEALKAEIAILSRKGGHILPPTQPPANSQIQTN